MFKKADSAAGCRLRTLAQSGTTSVQQCSHCSTLSVHFGALTLRFDAEALESLWNVVGQALMALHEQKQREDTLLPLRSVRAGEA